MADPIISVKEARKILGKEAEKISDKDLLKLIGDLDYIAKHLIRQYQDEKVTKKPKTKTSTQL